MLADSGRQGRKRFSIPLSVLLPVPAPAVSHLCRCAGTVVTCALPVYIMKVGTVLCHLCFWQSLVCIFTGTEIAGVHICLKYIFMLA